MSIGVTVLALATGCSSSSAPSTIARPAAVLGPWPAHPCALVSAVQVQTVVGGYVYAGRESSWAHGSTCAFGTSALYPARATDTTTVDVPIAGITVSFVDQMVFDARVNNVGPPGSAGQVPVFRKTAVAGLGDSAWQLTGIHFGEVAVIDGRYRLWFDVYAGMGEIPSLELALARSLVPAIHPAQ